MGLEGPFENFGEIKNQLENPKENWGRGEFKEELPPSEPPDERTVLPPEITRIDNLF